MSDTVITVENLSKAYLLGHHEKSDTFFGAVAAAAKAPLQNLRNLHRLNTFNLSKADEADEDILWALRDVSFEVKRGEVLGIIGRNGAGKSTLLKILSRIAQPTHGRAEIRGRVSALLEVGTGFHPELSGRENIYMNGTILGMRKAEIDAKFDEIVEFSGVERFLDTPVKRYSSGMTVRLAFAVAAHLEPEILIIDEVLAVGDAEFQKKCLGKMQDVSSGEGRTVLFVSHNMASIKHLCSKSILLSAGRIELEGSTEECINSYSFDRSLSISKEGSQDLRDWPLRKGSGEARIVFARLLDEAFAEQSTVKRMGCAILEFTFESTCSRELNLSAICMTNTGIKVLQLAHQDTPGFNPGIVNGSRTVRIIMDSLPLQCGKYEWVLSIHTLNLDTIDVVMSVLPFKVIDDLNTSRRPYVSKNVNGLCTLIAKWNYYT